MMKKDSRIKKGFTMVELTLAMIFISIILLTIAWLTMHITTIYQKGLAMKAVNATAKELIDDFSRSIAVSPALTVESQCDSIIDKDKNETTKKAHAECVKDAARKISYHQIYGEVKTRDKSIVVPVNGVFCTGRYSYIWNTAYAINKEDYIPAGGESVDYRASFNGNREFRLLKVQDFSKAICIQHIAENTYVYNTDSDYVLDDVEYVTDWKGSTEKISNSEEITDLLNSAENDLALYDLTFFSPTIHKLTSAGFYSGTFILATLRGGVDITAAGEFCSDPPDDLNTDFTYCSINKFNFSMRAAGEKIIMER